jgi:hypothetical protein
MIDQLCEVLRRQADAAEQVEARLRAVELIAAAGEQRFIGIALDELESAGEHLAALELTRTLTLSSAGLPMDVTATELCDAVLDDDEADSLRDVIASLAVAVDRLEDAKRRTQHVVATATQTNTRRLAAASALSTF